MNVENMNKALDEAYRFTVKYYPPYDGGNISRFEKMISAWKNAETETSRLAAAKQLAHFLTFRMGSFRDITLYPPEVIDFKDPSISLEVSELNKEAHAIFGNIFKTLRTYIEEQEEG